MRVDDSLFVVSAPCVSDNCSTKLLGTTERWLVVLMDIPVSLSSITAKIPAAIFGRGPVHTTCEGYQLRDMQDRLKVVVNGSRS